MTNKRERRLLNMLSELRVTLCATLLCAPYVALAWWLAHSAPYSALAAFAAATLIVWILVAVVARTWRRFLLWQFPLFLLSLIFAGYTLSYGVAPGRGIAEALATISLDAALSFFSVGAAQRLLLLATLICALYLWSAWRAPAVQIFREARRGRRAAVLALTGALSLCTALHADSMMDGIAANPVIGSALFVAGPWREARAASSDSNVARDPIGGAHAGIQ
jgi:glucan phosphoethanolaminetransferase (alkaline phosphatase superfamily)